MPAKKKKPRGRKIFAIVMLALLALLSVVNFKIAIEPFGKLVRHELSFENFVNEVQKGYLSDSFSHKNDFLNLNGAFVRLTGRRTLNEVCRLNNGMLSVAEPQKDITAMADGITIFSDFLRERDIPFLFVQLPYKESLDGQSFPIGVTSYANRNADDLLLRLSAGDVETLDIRPQLSQTLEMLEQYYYKTDHHWNSDGAFVAFQEISSYLQNRFPEGNIDLSYTQADQWNRYSIDDWFLGSRGKRVGIYFGGTDPLIWYSPKFETEMSFAVPGNTMFYQGDFTTANIRTEYIEGKNYFRYNSYCVYIGGDFSLVQHRNLDAPSPLKVMMIKDSYNLPLQAFLSTVFQEIDVIDPRYFSECTIPEYVERTEPDIVILAINPSALGGKQYYDFGVENVISIRSEGSVFDRVAQLDIEIEPVYDNNFTFEAYPLEANQVYRVSFEGVDILEGQPKGVGLRVFNRTTDTVLENAMFDLAYCEATNGFTWTFRTPDTQDELELLFYGGIYGFTAGNGVVYRNVVLEELRDQLVHDSLTE